jgi:hypothetical protein
MWWSFALLFDYGRPFFFDVDKKVCHFAKRARSAAKEQ